MAENCINVFVYLGYVIIKLTFLIKNYSHLLSFTLSLKTIRLKL